MRTGEWSGLDLMGTKEHTQGLADKGRPQVTPPAPQAIIFIYSAARGLCMGAALLLPDRTRARSIMPLAMETRPEYAKYIRNSHRRALTCSLC